MRRNEDTNMYSNVFLDKLGQEIHEGDIVVCPKRESFDHYDTGELVSGKVIAVPKSHIGRKIRIVTKETKNYLCDYDNLIVINKLLEK